MSSSKKLLLLLGALTTIMAIVAFVQLGVETEIAEDSEQETGTGSSAPIAAMDSLRRPNERLSDSELTAELYDELIALASTDPLTFRMRIDAAFAPPAEDHHALAALQAWQDSQADALPLLAEKLTDPNSSPSVRASSLQLLEPYCQFDGRARKAILEYLAMNPTDPGQRSSAFAHVLQWCDAQEIDSCMPLLQAESDPDVVLAAARALDSSRTPAARANLESLHWRHPDPQVRLKLRALGIGK